MKIKSNLFPTLLSEPTDMIDQINVDDVLMEYFGPSLEQLERDVEERLAPQAEAILENLEEMSRIGEDIDRNSMRQIE